MAQKDYEQILYRENLEVADPKKRVLAFLADDLLITLIVFATFGDMLFNSNLAAKEWIAAVNSIVMEVIVIKTLYHTFFTWYYGATIGKILLKIRIIELDTLDKPNAIVALTRSLFRILSELFFYLGFFPAFFDKLRQALQDKIARTVVVNV
jgi:uncharacterized RDD family membrane protein YckC